MDRESRTLNRSDQPEGVGDGLHLGLYMQKTMSQTEFYFTSFFLALNSLSRATGTSLLQRLLNFRP